MSDNKRKHNFDAFHRKRVDDREKLVRKALELLRPEKYNTLTELAKDVAKLITELERRQAKEGEQPKKEVAYTTFVRTGSKYKHILQAHLENESSKKTADEEDLEELRLHCASIEHENDLLRRRLESGGVNMSAQAASEGDYSRFKAEDVETLIDFIDGIMDQVRDLFAVVAPKDVDETYPDPGVYGPHGFIAEYETLERLTELRNAIK